MTSIFLGTLIGILAIAVIWLTYYVGVQQTVIKAHQATLEEHQRSIDNVVSTLDSHQKHLSLHDRRWS